MRQIKFRAKAINDGHYKGEWVYGYYLKSLCGGELVDVITDGANEIPIQVDTLGIGSCMNDENEQQIFEGDLVEWTFFSYYTGEEEETKVFGKIEWYQGGLVLKELAGDPLLDPFYGISELNTDSESDAKVLGNIYDNKDLME